MQGFYRYTCSHELHPVDVDFNDTIADVKIKICQHGGMRNDFTLMIDGEEVEDDLEMCDAMIEEECIFEITVGARKMARIRLKELGIKRDAAHGISAAAANNIEIIEMLHTSGFDLSKQCSREGTTPLMAGLKFVRMTKYLLQHYPSSIHKYDSRGNTALMHSIWSGNIKIIELLLDCDSSFLSSNIHTNNEGETIIDWAAMTGNIIVLKLLLSRGASFSSPEHVRSVSKLAIFFNQQEMATFVEGFLTQFTTQKDEEQQPAVSSKKARRLRKGRESAKA